MISKTQLGCILLAGVSTAFARPTVWKRQFDNSTTPSTVTVTGATGGDIAPRLELHDLMQNEDQWTIYLLALQSFQTTDPSNPLSWYQIGGIHGAPYTEYNGIAPCEDCDLFSGYCTHSSTLFPTWHRAYVALYEQALHANALAVANRYTGDDQQRYLAAAQPLRSPYWDWALPLTDGGEAFPSAFTVPTVDVNTPDGMQTIANPLLSYNFGNAEHDFMEGLDHTERQVSVTANTRAQSRSNLWTLLTSQSNYNEMSTRALDQRGDNPNSLEAIHDNIHVLLGGTMSDPAKAGFDPAFWLHHTMVDRIFTLYQAAWPDTWLASNDVIGHTFTYNNGTVQDGGSILEPFGINSETARDYTSFNYYWADLTEDVSPIDLINDLYGDVRSPSADPPATAHASKRSTEDNMRHEYVAKVKVDLPGTEGSFDLFIFDGEPDTTNPDKWVSDSDFLGQHGFFTDPKVGGDNSQISYASISMTAALQRRVARGELADMEPATVAAHLRAHMQWRVVDRFDRLVPNRNIPMLQVNVVTADVAIPAERGVMPTWKPFEQLVGCDGDVGAWISGWCANVD